MALREERSQGERGIQEAVVAVRDDMNNYLQQQRDVSIIIIDLLHLT
mgnify:CR=1 FL=1